MQNKRRSATDCRRHGTCERQLE